MFFEYYEWNRGENTRYIIYIVNIGATVTPVENQQPDAVFVASSSYLRRCGVASISCSFVRDTESRVHTQVHLTDDTQPAASSAALICAENRLNGGLTLNSVYNAKRPSLWCSSPTGQYPFSVSPACECVTAAINHPFILGRNFQPIM